MNPPATDTTRRAPTTPLAILRGFARRRPAVLATTLLVVLMATLATGIVLTQRQSRSRILSNLALRGVTSATFASTFLSQQADHESETAQRFLSSPRVAPQRFQMVVAAFGSNSAVLLDSAGRVLDVAPSDPSLIGKPIATHYAHLIAAENGQTAVSDVVRSAVKKVPVTAIAVPFSTPQGRRVFSAAYPISGSMLGAFVAHTITYSQHEVLLVDSSGHLVAASPATHASTLGATDPQLARAIQHSSLGSVAGAHTPTTFTWARVPGTPWRLVIAVPNSKLFSSVTGWTEEIPWIVFGLVSVLGLALVVAFTRLSALSERMAASARTDSLTGLCNRRAVEEHLDRAAAYARRHEQPMSVLMIDLDRFKQTNDHHGHAAGDRVLRTVADCMRKVLRAEDIPGRWGGDEFIVVLPSADEREARAVATRLQRAASGYDLADIGLAEGVSMSIGMATGTLTSTDEIIQAADAALYEQKSKRAPRARREAFGRAVRTPTPLRR